MNGRKADQPPLSCAECRASLQEYLDGTMVKTESLRVFLHLRTCDACARESARWQETFEALGSLPVLEPPEDFDRRILESVPYDSYRAMAELRRPRVPVFLEEQALPAFVRSLPTRLAGMVIAVGAAVAMCSFDASPYLGYVVAAGLLPEAVVRLQELARISVAALRRSEG